MSDSGDFKISLQLSAQRKKRPSRHEISYGSHATDHMFMGVHTHSHGWHDLRVMPYGPINLEPRALALHYGQTIFEGLKAYPQIDGTLALFRPEENARRFNRSARLMAMPEIPESLFISAVSALTDADRSWVPKSEGSALYLRPLMIASDPFLKVRSSDTHLFVIMACPMLHLSGDGSTGLRLLAREDIARTAYGDIGDAKTAANYAPTILPLEQARAAGYDNLLWLDAATHQQVEEAGITNFFVRYGDTVVTPPLSNRILAGITRDSVITLLAEQGYEVVQRDISIETLVADIESGQADELFVSGTATVIAPVVSLGFRNVEYRLPGTARLAYSLRDELLNIQYGRSKDTRDWRHSVTPHTN